MKEQREWERKRKKIDRKLEIENRDRYGERLTESQGQETQTEPRSKERCERGAWGSLESPGGKRGQSGFLCWWSTPKLHHAIFARH